MNEQSVSATRTIRAPAEIVFGLLVDPATHAAIDGTGWVRGTHDQEQLTAVGQIFRMGMFHPPDHLSNSLAHLEEVVADGLTPGPGRPRRP